LTLLVIIDKLDPMKTGRLLNTDGTEKIITPENGTDFKLEECYKHLGVDMVELVHCDRNMILICDEEALLKENPVQNVIPSLIARQPIFGNVIICHTSMFK
jgi:hypothetical protein